jgi:subtilisin family serine protease
MAPNLRRRASLLGAAAVALAATLAPRAASAAPTADPAVAPPAPPATAQVADDRLVVTLDPAATAGDVALLAASADATVESRTVSTVVLDPGPELQATRAELTALPGVARVAPNMSVHAAAVGTNDPIFPSQYALRNAQPGGMSVEDGWADTRGSRTVVVGVLDSGIDTDHEDLVANLWTNRTGINGCPYGTHGWDTFLAGDCFPEDDSAHGTHVSGIVGAVGNNGKGVSGVAQKVSLMSLKMLDDQGDGSIAGAVQAIDWALAAKASGVDLRVLQASWNAYGLDPASRQTLSDAIGRAEAAGVLFVAAAGNGDGFGSPYDLDASGFDSFPCEDSHANVVCVGASTQAGELAGFSNYGPGAVDIAAPGARIWSTVPPDVEPGCDPGSRYCQFDGTSMAAPMVSGAAALVWTAEPTLGVAAVKARLLAANDALPALDGVVAHGRLDVCKAIPNCNGLPAVPPTVPTDVRAVVGDGSVKVSWSPPASNGNSFVETGYELETAQGTLTLPFTARSRTITGLANNVRGTVRVRALGTAGPGPWETRTIRPYGGGLEIDRSGAIRKVTVGGKAPLAPVGAPRFTDGRAAGIAIAPEGTGGYVLDSFGRISRFRVGNDGLLPPVATGGPRWTFPIARGITVSPAGGGYVLDGFGGVHRFGPGPDAPPAPAHDGPYWPGWDITRGITLNDAGRAGYILDGYGAAHRFRIGAAGLPPPASQGPYWPGWDITRGITLVRGTGGGYILDGYGGVHRFAAGGSLPPTPSAPYFPGRDIARGIDT